MQDTSPLYRQILSDPGHYFEVSVVIGEIGDLVTEFGSRILFGGTAILVARSGPESGFWGSQIFSMKTSSRMFGNDPEIGQAIAQEIELQMLQPAGDIPPMAQVVPYVRVCTDSLQSEWLRQGVFYIDTRETTASYDGLQVLTLHGFDAMLKTEQDYADTGIDWPATDIDIVQEIATKIGVTVDPRTVALMTAGYTYPLPAGYTLREMLGYIASAYVGCFIITEDDQLRLVSLLELPPETNYLIDNAGDAITFGIDREGSEVTVSGGRIASFETEGVCDISELSATIVPKQDLHGYDKPWAGGSGENILPPPNISGSMSSVTASTSGDIITVNGTATAYGQVISSIIFTLPAGTYYFKWFEVSGSKSGSFSPQIRSTAGTTAYAVGSTSFTLTEETELKARVTYQGNAVFSNYKIKMMVSKGSTEPSEWTPYANGCPISGWTGATVSNTQNLISFEQGGITDATGSEAVNAGRIRSGYIPIEKIQKARNILTLLQADSVDIRKRYFYWYDANHTYIHEGHGTFNQAFPITLERSTIPNGAKYLRIVLQNANNSLPVLPDGYNVSINATTVPVSWEDEAGTVYGGTIDFVSGELTATFKISSYNDAWSVASNGVFYLDGKATDGKSGTVDQPYTVYCNIYPSGYHGGSSHVGLQHPKTLCTQTLNGLRFIVYDPSFASVSDFNTYVALNPIQIAYPLATPLTYQLTGKQLTTLAEQNNIFVDTGSIEEVKYLIPTSEVTRILV